MLQALRMSFNDIVNPVFFSENGLMASILNNPSLTKPNISYAIESEKKHKVK